MIIVSFISSAMKLGPGHFLAVSASLCILTNHVEAQSPCDEACDEHIGFPTVSLDLPRKVLYWLTSLFENSVQ